MAPESRFGLNTYGSKADKDMLNAKVFLSTRQGTPDAGLFFCQQAIEKYFKHILVMNGGPMESLRKHKLLPLAKEAGFCVSHQAHYVLRELSQLYYDRYPTEGDDLPEEPTWDELEESYSVALEIQAWIYAEVDARKQSLQNSLRGMHLE